MKTKNIIRVIAFITLLSILAVSLISCGKGYDEISPKAAKKIMDKEKGVAIVDARSKTEYDEGHIEDAILITVDDAKVMAPMLLATKQQTILIYSNKGERSQSLAKVLSSLGYENVKDFGGLDKWEYGLVK